MPIVRMKRNLTGKLHVMNLHEVMDAMPQIVADALTAPADPDGELGPEDVNVWEAELPEFDYHDIDHHDLVITVLANNFPSRMANLDERRQQIIDKVRPLLQKGVTFFVWVLCMPSSWGEGVGGAE